MLALVLIVHLMSKQCYLTTVFVVTVAEIRRACKLEAGHSIECITHAGHSIAFLHFVTL